MGSERSLAPLQTRPYLPSVILSRLQIPSVQVLSVRTGGLGPSRVHLRVLHPIGRGGESAACRSAIQRRLSGRVQTSACGEGAATQASGGYVGGRALAPGLGIERGRGGGGGGRGRGLPARRPQTRRVGQGGFPIGRGTCAIMYRRKS